MRIEKRRDNSKLFLNEALFVEKFNTMPAWLKRFIKVPSVDANGKEIPDWTLQQALRYYFSDTETVKPTIFDMSRNNPGAHRNIDRKAFRGGADFNPYSLENLNFKDIPVDPKWKAKLSTKDRKREDGTIIPHSEWENIEGNWYHIYDKITREDPNKVVIFHAVSYYPPGHPREGEQLDEAVYWPTNTFKSGNGSDKNTSFIYQTPLRVIKSKEHNPDFKESVRLLSDVSEFTAENAKTYIKDIVYVDIAASTDITARGAAIPDTLKALGINVDDTNTFRMSIDENSPYGWIAKVEVTNVINNDTGKILEEETVEKANNMLVHLKSIFDKRVADGRLVEDALSVFKSDDIPEGYSYFDNDYVFVVPEETSFDTNNLVLTVVLNQLAASIKQTKDSYKITGEPYRSNPGTIKYDTDSTGKKTASLSYGDTGDKEFYDSPSPKDPNPSWRIPYEQGAGTMRSGKSARGVIYGQDRNKDKAGTSDYDKSGYLKPDFEKYLAKTKAGTSFAKELKFLRDALNFAILKLGEIVSNPSQYNPKGEKSFRKDINSTQGLLIDYEELISDMEVDIRNLIKENSDYDNLEKIDKLVAEYRPKFNKIKNEYDQKSTKFRKFIGEENLTSIDWFDGPIEELPSTFNN